MLNIFSHAYLSIIYLLCEVLFRTLPIFLLGFLLLNFKNYLYILDKPYKIHLLQVFPSNLYGRKPLDPMSFISYRKMCLFGRIGYFFGCLSLQVNFSYPTDNSTSSVFWLFPHSEMQKFYPIYIYSYLVHKLIIIDFYPSNSVPETFHFLFSFITVV